MKHLILFISLLLLNTSLIFAEAKIRGDYEVVGAPVTLHSLDKVVFEEFMNFGCPHCNHFRLKSKELREKYAKRVEFIDVPVLFRGQVDDVARFFYVAQSIGKGDLVKDELFNAKFKYNVDNFDPGIVNYLARSLGLWEVYQKEKQQSWVTDKIKETEAKAERYGIQSTPTVVLAHSLKMGPKNSMEGFIEMLPQTLDDLLKPQ
ncbi:thioredoxin domain-containing protein [Deltaproteobacteria bacterium TL4]